MDFNSLLETAKKMGETASNQQKELENKSFNFSCQNNLITGKINIPYLSGISGGLKRGNLLKM